jgi:hypothetical protein
MRQTPDLKPSSIATRVGHLTTEFHFPGCGLQAIEQNAAHGEEKADRLATALIAALAAQFSIPQTASK